MPGSQPGMNNRAQARLSVEQAASRTAVEACSAPRQDILPEQPLTSSVSKCDDRS